MFLDPPIQLPVRTSIHVRKRKVTGTDVHAPELDSLALEEPLEIRVSYVRRDRTRVVRVLTVTMRTPGNDAALISGHIFTAGIIHSIDDIEAMEMESNDSVAAPQVATVRLRDSVRFTPSRHGRTGTMHASCGVCGSAGLEQLQLPASLRIPDRTGIERALVHDLPQRMRLAQPAFERTGGLHAAAVFSSNGDALGVCEDVGRHNALDKVIGQCLQEKTLHGAGCVLCMSGRLSYEILQKALIARIGIVAGVGAPSSRAVTMAEDFHVTLLGFVRNQSYNIYTHPERIL